MDTEKVISRWSKVAEAQACLKEQQKGQCLLDKSEGCGEWKQIRSEMEREVISGRPETMEGTSVPFLSCLLHQSCT